MSGAWVIDIDGVVWLAGRPLPGAAGAVDRLRRSGRRALFVTNNSSRTVGEQEAALARCGIHAAGDVVTSAAAAARLVQPGSTVTVCGGPGITEAVGPRARVVDADHPAPQGTAAVIVGLDERFSYRRLTHASGAVRRGAALIATNTDPTYPTPDGPVPGAGSLVAAVATAADVTPVVAGKPHQPMVELVRETLGGDPEVVVGDRPSTDGVFAARLGVPFVLVRSGVAADPGERAVTGVEPVLVVGGLSEAVERLIG